MIGVNSINSSAGRLRSRSMCSVRYGRNYRGMETLCYGWPQRSRTLKPVLYTDLVVSRMQNRRKKKTVNDWILFLPWGLSVILVRNWSMTFRLFCVTFYLLVISIIGIFSAQPPDWNRCPSLLCSSLFSVYSFSLSFLSLSYHYSHSPDVLKYLPVCLAHKPVLSGDVQ